MKRGLESVGFLQHGGTLLGLCLGYSCPMNHGQGIGSLLRTYGVDPGLHDWAQGQPGRWKQQPESWAPIRRKPSCLHLGEDRRSKRVVLASSALWESSVDLRRVVPHLVSAYDATPVIAGWNEGGFAVAVTEEYAPQLKALHESMKRQDVAMGVSILAAPCLGPYVLNGLKLIVLSEWQRLAPGDRVAVKVM